jgi:hypothetical protein
MTTKSTVAAILAGLALVSAPAIAWAQVLMPPITQPMPAIVPPAIGGKPGICQLVPTFWGCTAEDSQQQSLQDAAVKAKKEFIESQGKSEDSGVALQKSAAELYSTATSLKTSAEPNAGPEAHPAKTAPVTATARQSTTASATAPTMPLSTYQAGQSYIYDAQNKVWAMKTGPGGEILPPPKNPAGSSAVGDSPDDKAEPAKPAAKVPAAPAESAADTGGAGSKNPEPPSAPKPTQQQEETTAAKPEEQQQQAKPDEGAGSKAKTEDATVRQPAQPEEVQTPAATSTTIGDMLLGAIGELLGYVYAAIAAIGGTVIAIAAVKVAQHLMRRHRSVAEEHRRLNAVGDTEGGEQE